MLSSKVPPVITLVTKLCAHPVHVRVFVTLVLLPARASGAPVSFYYLAVDTENEVAEVRRLTRSEKERQC